MYHPGSSTEPPASPVPSLSTAHQSFLSRRHFPLLDGLRCLSIVAVVWHHAAGGIYQIGVLARGSEGVSLFFVISGFLITTLLLRERSAVGNISVRRFYLRRTLRIFPLYFAVLALYVVLVFLIEKQSVAGKDFWGNLPYFLTYTSNWFVPFSSDRVIFFFAWSLALEEQFYFFWPWVMKATTRVLIPLGTMLGVLALHYGAGFAVENGVLEPTSLSTRVLLGLSPALCLGAIAALLVHRPTTFRWIDRWIGWRFSPIAALAALVVALEFATIPAWVLYATMTWLVVACALRPEQPLGRVLTNPLVKHVGVVSYGIYLIHMLFLNFVRRLVQEHDGFLVFAVALPISIAAATLSYRSNRRFCAGKTGLQCAQ